MDDVSFKDIRVLSSGLELKGNNARTLADLLPQLQGGSVLKGLVVGTTGKGEIIFHTALGRFISPNPMGLGRGDTITIRLARDGEQLGGTIVKINNESPDLKESINLVFAKEEKNTNIPKSPGSATSIASSLKNDEIMGRSPQNNIIRGSISYLNLSKLDSNSALYKTLSTNLNQSGNNSISFKIASNSNSLDTSLQINGQVASESKNGSQLIRTDFAMIATKGTKFPNGQNLRLEINSINNKDVSSSAKEVVAKFIFDLNKNWQVMKKLDQSQYSLQTIQGSKNNINLSTSNIARANSSWSPAFLGQSSNISNSMAPSDGPPSSINNTSISQNPSSNLTLSRGNNIESLHPGTNAEHLSNKLNNGGRSYQIQSNGQTGQSSIIPPSGNKTSPLATNQTASSTSTSHNTLTNNNSASNPQPSKANEGSGSIQNMSSQTISNQQSRSIEEMAVITKLGLQNNLIAINAAESSDLISSLRLNSRKLRSNLKKEFLEEEGIDLIGKNTSKTKSADNTKPKGLNNVLKNLSDIETVKKMSENLSSIKEMFSMMNEMKNANENHWQGLFVPFHYNKEIIDQEISIQKKKDGSLRFLLNATFESFGDIQLDGFVTFKDIQSKAIKSFDLVVRSKTRIDSEIFRSINKIYTNSSQITGIDGNLKFDENSSFVETNNKS